MVAEGGVAEEEGLEGTGEAVVFPGPTRKKFPAIGLPKDVLVAKLVMLNLFLNEAWGPIVPLKNASAVVLKLSGWT